MDHAARAHAGTVWPQLGPCRTCARWYSLAAARTMPHVHTLVQFGRSYDQDLIRGGEMVVVGGEDGGGFDAVCHLGVSKFPR
eukprot:150884-Chlamydomonas_euryale.AAC.1